MSNEQKKILRRLYWLSVPLILLAIAIVVKLFQIQWFEGPALRAESEKEVIKNIAIEARRGSIFSSDGKLLATNMAVYSIHFDPTTASDNIFNSGIDSLSIGLARILGQKSSKQWNALFRSSRNQGDAFVTLSASVNHRTLKELKALPIFREGRYKGGLLHNQKNHRKLPLGSIAERTIGFDEPFRRMGLEEAYSHELKGTDGLRLAQRISKSYWKPLTDYYSQEPEDGIDLVSTIDSRLQDISHDVLENTLSRYKADHGCVVLMEVATGKIRAIANLGRNSSGSGYYEKRNYAVWESTEPGSTFKTIALMLALEDGVVDTSTQVNTGNGLYTIYGERVEDSNYGNGNGGYGIISLGRAFEQSSNTGIVKALYPLYKNKPEQFVDRLYALGMDKPLGIDIKGEGMPKIPHPSDKKAWSGISLPWMMFGYEVSFTPLQILAYYNAIANNGVLVKPQLVERFERMGSPIKEFEPEILNPSICSQNTLDQLQSLLKNVVERGTGKSLKHDLFAMAGKTGTSQSQYWLGTEGQSYQSSFVGYFPADEPKYSCIVVIQKPDKSIGYYGAKVAGPVFKEVAMAVHRLSPPVWSEPQITHYTYNNSRRQGVQKSLERQEMPNLKGLRLIDAIELMENGGLKVKLEGFSGKVRRQWPATGKSLKTIPTVIIYAG